MPIDFHCAGSSSVVYVEDQHINVLLMQALLARRPDLHMLVATTGQEALALVEGLSPVLLLVDIRLPDCLGTDLLPRLRQHPGCRHVPAVAVTAETHFRIDSTSFAEVWTKPLRFEKVLARLAQLVPLHAESGASNEPAVRAERERPSVVARGWR